ncbi:MAG: hypothetical protein FWD23_08880 [Oscillospiraceae bacterium]|nr:hypothetical protein [Oscillospiraceae bacterium]
MKTPKTIFLRAVAVISALIFSVSALLFAAACQSTEKESKNENADAGGQGDSKDTKTTGEDPLAKFKDGLGEFDFKGESFKVLVFDNPNGQQLIDTEEENGDVFNDALYKRNREIEQRFNVIIDQLLTEDNAYAKTKNIIKSGDSTAFDMFYARCPDAITAWGEGLIYSYDDLPLTDLSKPYWNQSANKTLTLDGNQYVALGSFNITSYLITHCLIFNKKMVQDFDFENPYNLVSDGKWTCDKMEEMMKAVISDQNGDGVMTKEDRYGYSAHPKQVLPSFWIAADTFSVGKDENDIPYLAMGNEKFINAFDKIFDILWDSGAYFDTKDYSLDIPVPVREMFANNQLLFMDMTWAVLDAMRATETDFGILPYPKFNEAQNDYVSRIEYVMSYHIPITVSDLERAGVMTEAFYAHSARTVIPALYEIALKTKSTRDEESEAMLDLILRTTVVDLGDTVLCGEIRDAFMADMFTRNNRNIVSQIEKTEKIIQRFISKIP